VRHVGKADKGTRKLFIDKKVFFFLKKSFPCYPITPSPDRPRPFYSENETALLEKGGQERRR
jgi:hypothetical protein